MFNQKTLSEELTDYIKRNLRKGYTLDSLRVALTNQDYSKLEIEKAKMDIQLAQQKMQADIQMEQQKMEAELVLAREKMAMELKIKEAELMITTQQVEITDGEGKPAVNKAGEKYSPMTLHIMSAENGVKKGVTRSKR